MSHRTCNVPGCEGMHVAKGLCNKHYRRMLATGSVGKRERYRQSDLECTIDGCARRREKRQMCGMHYLRWYNHGDPEYARQTYEQCTVDDCEDRTRSATSSLCEKHYYRLRRNGHLGLTDTRQALATYRALHSRIARDRGKATDHLCVDCGSQAEHWTYNHEDSNELESPTGQPYSMSIKNYDPRCRRCHAIFDGTGRNQYSAETSLNQPGAGMHARESQGSLPLPAPP